MNKKFNLTTPEVVNYLKNAGEKFEVVDVKYSYLNDLISRKEAQWIEKNFPVADWGRINWKAVSNSHCKLWGDDYSKIVWYFQEIVNSNSLSGYVYIEWDNLLLKPLYLKNDVVLRHIKYIAQESFDTWIYSSELKWCVEIYHEGEICFGYSPLTIK